MKLAFLFADSHHVLHLVSGQVSGWRKHITADDLEAKARQLADNLGADARDWDYVGALQNGLLNGPVWYLPDEEREAAKAKAEGRS